MKIGPFSLILIVMGISQTPLLRIHRATDELSCTASRPDDKESLDTRLGHPMGRVRPSGSQGATRAPPS
jgi:hypothetical protein